MKTAREYWYSRFGEYPQNDNDKLAVVMMREYAEQYHKSKLAELEFEALCDPDIYEASANEHFEEEANYVTDEDIEKWANTQCLIEPMRGYSKASMILAAKAMRDCEIKHT